MSIRPLPVLISEELFLHQNKKAQNIFERSQKKVQNKKQNLLQLSEHKECGFMWHQYEQALNSGTHNSCFASTWMQWHSYQQALNLHGLIYLLRQLCYGMCLNKQWIWVLRILALLLLNAVASVLTSNEFEYPNSAC